jgi:hypothetical protein
MAVVGVTDDELSLQERVARHRERYPDADVIAIAGALGESPTAVADVLDDDGTDQGGDLSKDAVDRVSRSRERPRTDLHTCPTLEAESGVWADNVEAYDCWMPWQYFDGRKQPHAPYADVENQMSWSDPECWRDAKRCRMACVDDRLEGPGIVLQHEDDPYADWADPFYIVDYDDVRDPESGAVHPVVAGHVEAAESYTDVSTSGTGVHIIAKGQLPAGVKTIQTALPDHDAFPDAEIEVYDGKRFVAMTGDHVVGTPTEATEAQAFLEDLVDEFVQEEERRPETPRPDSENWEPEYDQKDLEDLDTTEDIQAVFDACRQVRPRDIRLRSSLTEERADGTKSFDPSWETSRSGTRLGWDADIGWIYRKGDVGLDAIQVVALEERIISSPHEYPEGEDWWRAVEELRERGARIPEYEHPESDGRSDEDRHPLLEAALANGADVDAGPESTLPLAQLEALELDERRRAARKRGLDWPSTEEARERLLSTIKQAMRHEDETVVDAPTSLGKSYTIDATRWDVFDDVTGDKPVVHLSATRDARDEAARAAREDGGEHMVLLSRHEACPVAAGDHDPREVQEADADRQVVTIDGEPASQWLDHQCDGKGLPFSAAHQYLAEHNDQGVKLPCCRGESATYDEDEGDFDDGEPAQCEALRQWDRWREGDHPLVIATHNFAHVPGLRMHTNVVIDEQPDFAQDLSKERIERAITAYLQAADAPVQTWEQFITLAGYDGYGDDAAHEREQLGNCLEYDPDREWYLQEEDAHTLAPALARAIFHAEDRGNGRRFGKTPHEPPRLDANAGEDDAWNRVWVSVTLDEDNDVRTVRSAPDFSQARSVIGLDAHPAQPVWAVNTVPHINTTDVLGAEERRLWRRYERGLRVVQVGDATRPLASGEYWQDEQVRAIAEHLREEFGAAFRTAISTAAVEPHLQDLLADAGVQDPDTMHYGEEKSRNDFAGEQVGLVEGCVDPGDDYVLDLLAELDLDAEPETVDVDGAEERAHGRGFDGPDADTAQAILASVRENHTAQAAGRYARDPDDPDSHATVFVRTDAMPREFADVQVDGVEWTFSDVQRAIVDELRSATGAVSALEVADAAGCSKEHARETLARLADQGVVQALEGAGEHGATLYADDGCPHSGVVDLEGDEQSIANSHVQDPYTWSLAIRDPDTANEVLTTGATADQDRETTVWDWRAGPDPG